MLTGNNGKEFPDIEPRTTQNHTNAGEDSGRCTICVSAVRSTASPCLACLRHTRVSFARAGFASQLAAPSQTRPRSDSSDWVGASGFGTKDHYGAHLCRSCRTPVGKWGSVEQARLQNRDPFGYAQGRLCADHPAGACLMDGRDSVRVRRCRNGYKTTITATACSCGLVGFVVILKPPTDSRLVRLHAVPAVEPKTTVHTPLVSGPGRSPRPGCGHLRNQRQRISFIQLKIWEKCILNYLHCTRFFR